MSSDLPGTVIYPRAFSQSPSAANDGAFHWEWIASAIDLRGISPTDIDAIIGVRHHTTIRQPGGVFLAFETKNKGISIQQGQQWLLDDLLATGLVTVVYQTGKEWPHSWSYQTFDQPRSAEQDNGLEPDRRSGSLFKLVSQWSRWAQSLDPHEWRRRMIRAALNNAPTEVWLWLRQFIIDEDKRMLGAFADTPLGKASISAILPPE